MKELVDWKDVNKKIASTIKKIYKKDSQYISAQYVSEEMFKNQLFPCVSYRTVILRTTLAMKEKMKWSIYANRAKGPIFIVPSTWWEKNNGGFGK